ncbi:hypothetical protein GEMRC1_012066 [Eukaryota sp. GEM-RC1]
MNSLDDLETSLSDHTTIKSGRFCLDTNSLNLSSHDPPPQRHNSPQSFSSPWELSLSLSDSDSEIPISQPLSITVHPPRPPVPPSNPTKTFERVSQELNELAEELKEKEIQLAHRELELQQKEKSSSPKRDQSVLTKENARLRDSFNNLSRTNNQLKFELESVQNELLSIKSKYSQISVENDRLVSTVATQRSLISDLKEVLASYGQPIKTKSKKKATNRAQSTTDLTKIINILSF